MVKIIHTADNHIGKKFNSGRYSPDASSTLIQERLDALNQVVEQGDANQADFLIVAGDLFDSVDTSAKLIREVLSILKKFTGKAVLITPGNHDFFENRKGSLWEKFEELKGNDDSILLLFRPEPVHFSVREQDVWFYPGPCESRHSQENAIAWIQSVPKDPSAVHIGIAHGNVEGLGYPGDRYFNMTKADLKQAGMDIWALGHIHVPHPASDKLASEGFFFPSTHTPDGFDCRHEGHCWLLEINDKKEVSHTLLKTGNVRFVTMEEELGSGDEGEVFLEKIRSMAYKAMTAIKISICGRMSKSDRSAFNRQLEALRNDFLHFEIDLGALGISIDQAYIDSFFAGGSLPHRLLCELAQKDTSGLALQMADGLINQSKINTKEELS